MAARSSRQSRDPLAGAQRRFARWRATRRPGTRIPKDLWDLATELAGEHGVSKTASTLGLDYHKLKKRVAARKERSLAVVSEPDFVEVPFVTLPSRSSCVLELRDRAGVQLRVELTGVNADEIETVARGLWKASR